MTGYIVRHTRRNNIVLTNMEEGMHGRERSTWRGECEGEGTARLKVGQVRGRVATIGKIRSTQKGRCEGEASHGGTSHVSSTFTSKTSGGAGVMAPGGRPGVGAAGEWAV